MQFCRQHRLLLRQVPCKFVKVWLSTSKVNNEISVKFDWVFQKLFIWTPFRRQFSTVFNVILQAPSPGITASSLSIWRSLIKYCESYSFRRQCRRQFSTVFHVILQATSTAITASSLLVWQSLIKYFKSC